MNKKQNNLFLIRLFWRFIWGDKMANDFQVNRQFAKFKGKDVLIGLKNWEELEKQGFTVTEYKDGNFEGFTLSKKIDNIDDVSTDSDSVYDLSGMMENKEENGVIFPKGTYGCQNHSTSDSSTCEKVSNAISWFFISSPNL